MSPAGLCTTVLCVTFDLKLCFVCYIFLLLLFFRLKFEYHEQEEETISCYDNDPELPIFLTVASGYPASELAHILLAKDIDQKEVCHIQLLGVTRSATFLVDLDDVSFRDLKADDLGVWTGNGTKSTYFRCHLVD